MNAHESCGVYRGGGEQWAAGFRYRLVMVVMYHKLRCVVGVLYRMKVREWVSDCGSVDLRWVGLDL